MFKRAFILATIGAPVFLGFLAIFFGFWTGSGADGGVGDLASVVAGTFSPVVDGARVLDGVGSPNLNDSEVEEALLMPEATLE